MRKRGARRSEELAVEDLGNHVIGDLKEFDGGILPGVLKSSHPALRQEPDAPDFARLPGEGKVRRGCQAQTNNDKQIAARRHVVAFQTETNNPEEWNLQMPIRCGIKAEFCSIISTSSARFLFIRSPRRRAAAVPAGW